MSVVSVPEPFRPLFEEAERQVAEYFAELRALPEEGTVEISGERYVLVRAASLSKELFETVRTLYSGQGEAEARRVALGFLYDIAKTIGMSDARHFHERMGVTDPVAKLSAGPVHFAHAGWASVDILPESTPAPDERFLLVYHHPYSFEADAWIRAGVQSPHPVCRMNAGYSAGWCEESFGLPLVAVEIACRARGDSHCTFVMAPPDRVEAHCAARLARATAAGEPRPDLEVPEFFERKRLEEELRRERDFTAAVLDTVGALVVVLDREGRIVRFNRACEATTGFSAAEVQGEPFFRRLIPEEERAAVVDVFARLRDLGSPLSAENHWLTKEGGRRLIAWSNSALRGPDGSVQFVIGTGIDVTEKRQLEADLRQAQKLEAVGRLASGIAHEINTPIQFVGDNLVFLREAFDDVTSLVDGLEALVAGAGPGPGPERASSGAEVRSLLDEADAPYLRDNVPDALDAIEEGVRRVTAIVLAMKEFGHPSSAVCGPVDVNRALLNTLTVARNEYKYVADLETDFGELPLVEGLEGELNQVFLNLVVNAAHAIGEIVSRDGGRGTITVRTRVEAGSVVVEVSDTGGGVPAELAERIFDPFFTTKEVGVGSGQGLAIARSVVVDKHRGSITCDSPPGQGARFTIRLPLPCSTDERLGNITLE